MGLSSESPLHHMLRLDSLGQASLIKRRKADSMRLKLLKNSKKRGIICSQSSHRVWAQASVGEVTLSQVHPMLPGKRPMKASEITHAYPKLLKAPSRRVRKQNFLRNLSTSTKIQLNSSSRPCRKFSVQSLLWSRNAEI